MLGHNKALVGWAITDRQQGFYKNSLIIAIPIGPGPTDQMI